MNFNSYALCAQIRCSNSNIIAGSAVNFLFSLLVIALVSWSIFLSMTRKTLIRFHGLQIQDSFTEFWYFNLFEFLLFSFSSFFCFVDCRCDSSVPYVNSTLILHKNVSSLYSVYVIYQNHSYDRQKSTYHFFHRSVSNGRQMHSLQSYHTRDFLRYSTGCH